MKKLVVLELSRVSTTNVEGGSKLMDLRTAKKKATKSGEEVCYDP